MAALLLLLILSAAIWVRTGAGLGSRSVLRAHMAPKAMKAKGSSKPKAGPMKALKKAVKSKAGPMKSKAKAKPQSSTPHKKLGQLGSNDLLYKLKAMAKKGRPYPLRAYKSLGRETRISEQIGARP